MKKMANTPRFGPTFNGLLSVFLGTLICSTLSTSPDKEYRGQFIGKFNTYAHQVSGDVYAIDEYTFLIRNFFYDGLASGRFTPGILVGFALN